MWAYPPGRFEANTLTDSLEFSKFIASYVAEISGGLSEHNFTEGIGTDLLDAGLIEENFAVRLFLTVDDVSPLAPTTGEKLPVSSAWKVIETSEAEYGYPAGKLLVFINFGYHASDYTVNGPPLEFCIGLDGVPQMDTLAGSGDLSNDYMSTDATTPPEVVNFSGGGFRAFDETHRVQGVINVSPGRHIISLMVRCTFDLTTDDSTDMPVFYMGTTETILIHLWA